MAEIVSTYGWIAFAVLIGALLGMGMRELYFESKKQEEIEAIEKAEEFTERQKRLLIESLRRRRAETDIFCWLALGVSFALLVGFLITSF